MKKLFLLGLFTLNCVVFYAQKGANIVGIGPAIINEIKKDIKPGLGFVAYYERGLTNKFALKASIKAFGTADSIQRFTTNNKILMIETKEKIFFLEPEILYYFRGQGQGLFLGLSPNLALLTRKDNESAAKKYAPRTNFGISSTLGYRLPIGERWSITPVICLGGLSETNIRIDSGIYYTANLSLAYKF